MVGLAYDLFIWLGDPVDKETSEVLSQLVQKLPGDAFKRLADVAITGFEKCISPVTETLGGWGTILRLRFEARATHEKILIAETFEEARRKAGTKGTSYSPDNINLQIAVMDVAARESDPLKREYLSNLLANEYLRGKLHPMFVEILDQLTDREITLLRFYYRVADHLPLMTLEETETFINAVGIGSTRKRAEAACRMFNFDYEYFLFGVSVLQRHGLINNRRERITMIGIELMRSITAPD
jgi:hypothetical protein